MIQNKNIYLDNASTTQLSPSTKKYLIELLDTYGNPSSLHSVGESASKILNNARKTVSKFINAESNNIYFTSSGSASNTLGIRGYYRKNNCCILYSPIAHKSILKCVKDYKYSFPLKVNNEGFIDIIDLKKRLRTIDIKPFVIIDYANSEIGTIQNVKEIIDIVHFYDGIIYLDCTASISTIPLDVKTLNVDMCGFSAHKLNALKGCGVLYKKQNIELESLVYGNQEHGLIGGTENILGIASLSKVIETYDYSSISSESRDFVYNYIVKNITDSYLVGSFENRLTHNLYICFKGVEGESLMLLLDMNGIQVSTGSACNSNDSIPSQTLMSIGVNRYDIHSCIRMTFNGNETKEELNYVCIKLNECVKNLRELNKL